LECRRPPTVADSQARTPSSPLTRGVFHFSPRQEDSRQGPVGVGSARCELYVYAWQQNNACRLQLNHCGVDGNNESNIVCLSLADERTVACGQQIDACGQQVQCDCPTGEALAVPEAPNTVHLTPQQRDVALRSANEQCQAVSGLPSWAANAPPPPPCFFSIRECTRGTASDIGCIERNEMLSCGVRATICDTPVKCECPDAGLMSATPAPTRESAHSAR
jgi:hypothetical protein